MAEAQVPVITVVDVSQSEEAAAAQVRRACTEAGFFYVSGHGVPDRLVAEFFEQVRAAFSLPKEAKMAMLADENNRGYTPFAEETLDPAAQTRGDTKEGFYFGREVPADSEEAALPLHGPNQWPPEELLPGFRATTEAYMQALTALGRRLLRLLALALGLEAEFFAPHFTSPMVALRPLHYNAEVSAPEGGVFGAGAHTDYGMLTLLATDDVPGLQVKLGGTWRDVAPLPGCFIVNLGDMLERWTNGLFRSTLHRVVNTSGRERHSAALFFEPNFTARVECLPCCVSAERPARYSPTTAGEHLLAKYATTHAGYDAGAKQRRLAGAPSQQGRTGEC